MQRFSQSVDLRIARAVLRPYSAAVRWRIDKTRDKMKRGGLPAPFPGRPWRGSGSDEPCSGCGDAIARTETQIDIDVRGALTLAFHEECYRAWASFPEMP